MSTLVPKQNKMLSQAERGQVVRSETGVEVDTKLNGAMVRGCSLVADHLNYIQKVLGSICNISVKKISGYIYKRFQDETLDSYCQSK